MRFDGIAVKRVVRLPNRVCPPSRARAVTSAFDKLQRDGRWALEPGPCLCEISPTLSKALHWFRAHQREVVEKVDLAKPAYLRDEAVGSGVQGLPERPNFRLPRDYTRLLFLEEHRYKGRAGTRIWFGSQASYWEPGTLIFLRLWFEGDPFHLASVPC